MIIDANLDNFIFMKVGRHAGEDFDEIIARKREEFERVGATWWGYGGSTLHPTKRVRPFARHVIEHGGGLVVVMQSIVSNHPDTKVYARSP
jgi:broad specificity phosphatase PhoE